MARGVKAHAATAFLRQAEEFFAAARDAFAAGRWNACGFNAIQSMINANDALTAYLLGFVGSMDHREAIRLHADAVRTLGDSSQREVLKRALDERSAFGYLGIGMSKARAERPPGRGAIFRVGPPNPARFDEALTLPVSGPCRAASGLPVADPPNHGIEGKPRSESSARMRRTLWPDLRQTARVPSTELSAGEAALLAPLMPSFAGIALVRQEEPLVVAPRAVFPDHVLEQHRLGRRGSFREVPADGIRPLAYRLDDKHGGGVRDSSHLSGSPSKESLLGEESGRSGCRGTIPLIQPRRGNC